MANRKISLKDHEVIALGLELGNRFNSYRITPEQEIELQGIRLENKKEEVANEERSIKVDSDSDTVISGYKKKFVLSAWNDETGLMMDIDAYCDHYNLPRTDITSYKLVSHTGTPYYNIVFKENISEIVQDFDFESIIQQYIKPVSVLKAPPIKKGKDFDTLTYTDVHVGMDTDKYGQSMYAVPWNREEIMKHVKIMVDTTIAEKESNTLVVDELGDLLDGFDGQTTRGGHALPQNMTNEEAFDCALELKMYIADRLIPQYESVQFNNICNDNHAGSFGYFVNSSFKQICAEKYPGVIVNNHRQFMNYYYVKGVCNVITHGKDDKSLKFGFKPFLEPKGIEKIDQYCKQNDLYKGGEQIIFKKGDSHQALFDMCTSDDFYYFNYPALSPSSQWVQTNFKAGRRGFFNESYKDGKIYLKPTFIK